MCIFSINCFLVRIFLHVSLAVLCKLSNETICMRPCGVLHFTVSMYRQLTQSLRTNQESLFEIIFGHLLPLLDGHRRDREEMKGKKSWGTTSGVSYNRSAVSESHQWPPCSGINFCHLFCTLLSSIALTGNERRTTCKTGQTMANSSLVSNLVFIKTSRNGRQQKHGKHVLPY